MNQNHSQNLYHANLNANLMVENVIQIKSRIMINVNVSAKIQKDIMPANYQIIFGIQEHVLVKMVNIQKLILIIK